MDRTHGEEGLHIVFARVLRFGDAHDEVIAAVELDGSTHNRSLRVSKEHLDAIALDNAYASVGRLLLLGKQAAFDQLELARHLVVLIGGAGYADADVLIVRFFLGV